MLNINQILLFAIPLIFVTVWCFTLWLISRLSGWNKLAGTFHYPDKFTGHVFSFQSARINWANFNNGLKIGVSQQGLYMVPMLFFRIFFPPLLIPWSEISTEPKKRFMVAYQQLRLKSFPRHKIDIQQKTFEKITKALEEQTRDQSAGQKP